MKAYLYDYENIRWNTYFGSTLMIFDPPHVAMYKLPSVSMVMPSGTKPGFSPFALKSMATRSFAVEDT